LVKRRKTQRYSDSMSKTAEYDLVIRDGLVVDGSGAPGRSADVGIVDGRIAAVDAGLAGGREEIDARGLVVTPGFIDVHTHYDGQAIWADRFDPSSIHGVTTVVMGNCGVGFAPCRPAERDLLRTIMEGVEDIPEVVMTEGLTWEWESFREFLQAVDSRPHDIDVAAYLPHSALRIFAMGQRAADREPATSEEIVTMQGLVIEAMQAGAIGVSTSNTPVHRRGDGQPIPTVGVNHTEYAAIAKAMANTGGGVLQFSADTNASDESICMQELAMLQSIASESGITVTFSLAQPNDVANRCRVVMDEIDSQKRAGGPALRPQIFPRPVGMLLGHNLSANPFVMCPSYEPLCDLPLEDRIARLRARELRSRLIHETPSQPGLPLFQMVQNFERMFELGDPPNYEPSKEQSIAARAARLDVHPRELAYDLLLEDGGRRMLYVGIYNYAEYNLDFVLDLLPHPDVVVALGDGGAHYGLICDSSYPTFMLTHLTRDRAGRKLPLTAAVNHLTHRPASLMGFHDRGLLKPGYKADINVIDYEKLRLAAVDVRYDLPAGRRRLYQYAHGYRATLVSGQVIVQNDLPTAARPGRLVRGSGAALA
jgi:N-acyl-D-amino-acid deacylase